MGGAAYRHVDAATGDDGHGALEEDAAERRGDVVLADAAEGVVDEAGRGIAGIGQLGHAALHLVGHGAEDDVGLGTADGFSHGGRGQHLGRHIVFLLALCLDLRHEDHGRRRRHGHPPGLGATQADERAALVASGNDVGEHGEGRSDEIDSTHKLVGTAVGEHTVDLEGRDIERIEAAALAGEGVAVAHGGEIVAVVLALTARLAETLVGAQLVELLVGDVGAVLHELEGFLVNVG